jgi:dipeptidyl aminopeptidase/acylaminoacyl peptidase
LGLLLEPDFFKVGVSSAGMYDPMWAHQTVPERHLGRPRFGGERYLKQKPDEVAGNFVKFSPSHYAERLVGHLLLVYGDLDENIQPAALLKFTDALIKADKHFDELCLPGRNHNFTVEPYFQKQMWDYFVAHLQAREPLIHHKLGVAAGTRMMI